MKRRMVFLLLCAVLLSGCGRAVQAPAGEHYMVMREQTKITLDAPAAPVLEALGIPCGYAENSGRAGIEKTYRFPGMDLKTYPGTDGERILGVQITGGTMRTPEGISVGTSAREVQLCYGLESVPSGSCTFRCSTDLLTLTIKNSVVTSICYSLA